MRTPTTINHQLTTKAIVIGLLFTFNLKAAEYRGEIIFEHDTLKVTFDIQMMYGEPRYERMQYRIRYIDAKGKKVILKPEEAKEIRFNYEGEEVRMLSRKNTIGTENAYSLGTHIFLKLDMDGYLKIFRYYYSQASPGKWDEEKGAFTYSIDRYILQKGDGDLLRSSGLSFKKDMTDYFQDCPQLLEKIENKKFRKDNLVEMVKYYNAECVRQ